MEDTGQDGASSPATPGAGKSKLDSLSKEDLIKFAKKQMILIQKVKSRCTDLEKEVEELKTKTVPGGADDVVQALTDRLDAVLLEKAETHQQLVSLKKELTKTKEENEAATKKASEVQQHLEQSNNNLLEEIAILKRDLSQSQNNHKEDVDTVKKELQDSLMKQKEFTEKLLQQEDQDAHIRKLEQELQHMSQDYEERISNLQKHLDSVTEEKNHEMIKLKDTQAASERYFCEIQDLHAKILELQVLHKEEVSNLMHDLETSTNEYEKEKSTFQDITNQYLDKEKKWQEESDISGKQNVTSQSEDEVQQLKCIIKELESQVSLLRDELTYTTNLKIGMERKVEHLKSEYFHEREELEFKINELQLAIEEYHSLIEKLKTELESTKIQYKQLAQQKATDSQSIRDQHKKEMHELTQAITSRFEDEKLSFVHEIQILKQQCEKLYQEKDEAVSSYENLRETFVSLQAELQDSAGKISREFKTMQHQQATDVHELQQKLRAAYKDKNDLLETVNQLRSQVDMLSSKESEYEELQLKITKLQQNNEEYIASLHQKEEFIKELQHKVNEDSKQNAEVSGLQEEIQKLQQMYKSEQVTVESLQQKVESQAILNAQLKKTNEELTKDLQESVSSHQSDCEDPHLQITWWQQKNEEVTATLQEKEELLKDLQLKMETATKQNSELSSKMQHASKELLELQETFKSEQAKALEFQQEAESHLELIAKFEQTVQELTQKLSITGQSLEEIKNLQQQVDTLLLDKQKLETDSRRWQDEVFQIREEKDVLSKDFDRIISDHSHCNASAEELSDLRKKVELITEEKDEVTRLLMSKEQHIETFRQQLCVLQDILTIECPDQDIISLLEEINKAVLQLKEEKEDILSQKAETSVQLERLHEEYEMQCSELRDLLSDYSKEKVLLKEELEETLRDKEALQKDLLEMKHALEKSKLDNQDLLSRIESLTFDLNSVQKETSTNVQSSEQEDLKVENRDSTLTQEVTNSEDLLSKSLDLQQKSLIEDLQNKIEKLERESKEKEEKCNKIKAVAIKGKKELDAKRKEVLSIKEELERVRAEKQQLMSSMKDVVQGAESYQNLLVEYDRQVELLELEKEKVRSTEHQLEELSRQRRTATLEQEKMNSVHEDLVTRLETLQSNNKLLEAQILESQKTKAALERDLEAERLIKEQKVKDHNCALKQVEELQVQLEKEKKQLQKVTQDFELVRKDAQKNTLMDMEMADYERLVKELNQNITSKSSQLEELEQEVRAQKQKQEILQEEISSLQTTLEQHEERSTKMKQLLVKTKKELADSKQMESDHLILQASLKGELEASHQLVEAYKIQVAELTSEKHKVQEQLRALTEQHHRAANTYQQKLLALQEECTAAKAGQAAVTAEFESYKVRVHNVLKQQKNKSASPAEQEIFRKEREHLQTMLDQVKAKLQETQHTLQMNTAELQALQSEHDMLLERHNKMLQETVTKEAELREKLCTLQSEHMVLKTEHAQVISQLSAQNEAQRNSFMDQVRRLQDDHRKTMETLQQQLSKVETQLFQVKSEATVTSPSGSQPPLKSSRERRPADLHILDLYSIAREEGEGMETTDNESVSSASTYAATLEQLLNSSDLKTAADIPQWHPEMSKEELTEKLNTTSKSVDHLSGLLHETEATNAVLMEQITLLKNEIRRLERNQEREKSVANLEYLKNVLLQFIFLKAGSERQSLLPVIDTMLQLSPEEKGKLFAIAQGEEESAARPAGWASYLHSWSGLR
ncbi:GRIP and coiled-coil domain-containing protein 2 isoform X1 [Bufo bufo]|uniref:GRIP and coiled-coil domain-containing protein 2 isoform X1 n=2 Tax=Bufo bufo TaxID=8384 RepID=UPI001ABDCAE9|nr:GRIP and coiled-coil domain-containing protein 2 isoform X1 [Bufo bufo]XP_040280994.1 GRIP and coiled-coil domain-containing protein 2 isoform X1 [Bufo bufo]